MNTSLASHTLRTGLPITEVGLGAAQFGNLYREIADAEVDRIVERAWDAGIRHFDTAPHYGMGLSERRLGRALRRYPRDEFVLSTKVGRLIRPNPGGEGIDPEGFCVPNTTKRVWDFSAAGVKRSLEESLDRLGLDRVDIAYMHDPDDHWDAALSEAAPQLRELREQGLIRAFGAGMNQSAMIARFFREADADVAMLAGRYTLLEQGALDDAIPAAEETGASIVIAGVYNSGLLAKPRPAADSHYNYEAAPTALIERAHRIADVAEAHGLTLPHLAVAFVLRQPQVASVVFGASRVDQLDQSLERYAAPVGDAVWEDLAAAGLIAS